MKKFLDRLIQGRMAKAEYEIAHILWKTEYPKESFDHILKMVRSGNISQIGKESSL